MAIKALLFDKDGTLIDFGDTFFEACTKIIYNLSNGDNQLAHQLAGAAEFDLETSTCPASSQIVGGTSLKIAQLWQPFLKRQSSEHLSRELDEIFDAYTVETVTAFDFTKPTLQKLSAMGLALGVATNDSEHNAHRHLDLIAISDLLPFVVGYDSGHGAKPEPGMVEAFADYTGCKTSEVAMVGDSINDLLAGKNAGAIAVAVTSGIADGDELQPFADYVLQDISQLLEFEGLVQGRG